MEIRDLLRNDGDELRALWRACGIRDRPGDDDASLAAMASRNPGLCIVGCEEGHIVASALAGFDGRRGWLYHVATHPDSRRRGIATRLVRTIEDRLLGDGLPEAQPDRVGGRGRGDGVLGPHRLLP